MDIFGGKPLETSKITIRRKRTQTSRRPRPESQQLPESLDRSPLSKAQPSDDVSKGSSDENTDVNSRRKVFHLNQCISRSISATGAEGESPHKKIKKDNGCSSLSNGGSGDGSEQGRNHRQFVEGSGAPGRDSVAIGDGVGSDKQLKKVKLKVGGVTRTIQAKSNSHGASGSGSKSTRSSDAPRSRQKLILQDNSDGDLSPPDKMSGLQGIPWKDFSSSGFHLGKDDSLTGKMPEKSASGKQKETSDRVRKTKRVPKKRSLGGEFGEDDEDDEIRYLEKLKSSKVSSGFRNEEQLDMKHRNLSKVSNLESGKDGKKASSESVSEEIGYEENPVSDGEPDGKKKKKPRKESPDSPIENKRETTLTTRQRALLSGKDASGASTIEFPNGLPPAPSRKQKEKLTEVEQQLKKAEATERRRMQNKKAAQESEAEAIRKILGQDSTRKKREDKLKKRQEELAQEKAASAQMLASIRWVMGPSGTVVTFPEDIGLPQIFDPKPCSYPPPREKCAGPSCTNPFKYRDSKSRLPLCSLQCYKAIHEKMQPETAC